MTSPPDTDVATAPPRPRLGRGLASLIPPAPAPASPARAAEPAAPGDAPQRVVRDLPVGRVTPGPYQPRRRFDDQAQQELLRSIRKHGVMQPIVVRALPDGPQETKEDGPRYEIIAGERRWRAIKALESAAIPAVIVEVSHEEALQLALIENIQRESLTPVEEAEGYRRLMDELSYTQEQLAEMVGKSRSHIANLLRLLALPDAVRAHLDAGRLTMGHARALLKLPNPDAVAERIIAQGLSVRDVEALGAKRPARAKTAAAAGSGKHRASATPSPQQNTDASPPASLSSSPTPDPDMQRLEDAISATVGLEIHVRDHGDGAGEVAIPYATPEALAEILERLGDR